MSCVVRGCRNVWYPKCSVKFHSFPKDQEMRNTWLSITPIKGKLYESARICSEHFLPDAYNPKRPGQLLKTAVPFHEYELCECCDQLECSNISSSSNTTLDENVSEVKATQLTLENEECSNISSSSNTTLDEDENVSEVKATQLTLEKKECTNIPSSSNTRLNANVSGLKATQLTLGKKEASRVVLKDNVQVNKKLARQENLSKTIKVLQQKVRRQAEKIKALKELIGVVRNYASRSEIENILKGNFAKIRKMFKCAKKKPRKYSDEVKAFALTVHFYSPKAYNYLKTKMSLPDETTLWRYR